MLLDSSGFLVNFTSFDGLISFELIIKCSLNSLTRFTKNPAKFIDFVLLDLEGNSAPIRRALVSYYSTSFRRAVKWRSTCGS